MKIHSKQQVQNKISKKICVSVNKSNFIKITKGVNNSLVNKQNLYALCFRKYLKLKNSNTQLERKKSNFSLFKDKIIYIESSKNLLGNVIEKSKWMFWPMQYISQLIKPSCKFNTLARNKLKYTKINFMHQPQQLENIVLKRYHIH